MNKNKRIIAIHLPQFYPFKENDEWWGKGFTEWSNVTKATPRFKGHYQPHLPTDLGFYDLRLKESRIEQEKLAKEYGIDGFCYYHYWFNGHLIMEKVVEAKLSNKDEDFPFMFCWANENWHRNWEGGFNTTLIEQNYSKEDDIEHFNYLLPFFKDSRYIKIDGKPVFAIYKIQYIPEIEEMINTFQEQATKNGFELYICKVEASGCQGEEWMKKGIDASIDFQPIHGECIMSKFDNFSANLIHHIFHKDKISRRFSYRKLVEKICSHPQNTKYKMYPCCCPSWDNASRRIGRPYTAYIGSTPFLFKKWFKTIYNEFQPFSKEENLIFINAWNEWAEGCHLEPDIKYGRGYLEAIKEVIYKIV